MSTHSAAPREARQNLPMRPLITRLQEKEDTEQRHFAPHSDLPSRSTRLLHHSPSGPAVSTNPPYLTRTTAVSRRTQRPTRRQASFALPCRTAGPNGVLFVALVVSLLTSPARCQASAAPDFTSLSADPARDALLRAVTRLQYLNETTEKQRDAPPVLDVSTFSGSLGTQTRNTDLQRATAPWDGLKDNAEIPSGGLRFVHWLSALPSVASEWSEKVTRGAILAQDLLHRWNETASHLRTAAGIVSNTTNVSLSPRALPSSVEPDVAGPSALSFLPQRPRDTELLQEAKKTPQQHTRSPTHSASSFSNEEDSQVRQKLATPWFPAFLTLLERHQDQKDKKKTSKAHSPITINRRITIDDKPVAFHRPGADGSVVSHLNSMVNGSIAEEASDVSRFTPKQSIPLASALDRLVQLSQTGQNQQAFPPPEKISQPWAPHNRAMRTKPLDGENEMPFVSHAEDVAPDSEPRFSPDVTAHSVASTEHYSPPSQARPPSQDSANADEYYEYTQLHSVYSLSNSGYPQSHLGYEQPRLAERQMSSTVSQNPSVYSGGSSSRIIKPNISYHSPQSTYSQPNAQFPPQQSWLKDMSQFKTLPLIFDVVPQEYAYDKPTAAHIQDRSDYTIYTEQNSRSSARESGSPPESKYRQLAEGHNLFRPDTTRRGLENNQLRPRTPESLKRLHPVIDARGSLTNTSGLTNLNDQMESATPKLPTLKTHSTNPSGLSSTFKIQPLAANPQNHLIALKSTTATAAPSITNNSQKHNLPSSSQNSDGLLHKLSDLSPDPKRPKEESCQAFGSFRSASESHPRYRNLQQVPKTSTSGSSNTSPSSSLQPTTNSLEIPQHSKPSPESHIPLPNSEVTAPTYRAIPLNTQVSPPNFRSAPSASQGRPLISRSAPPPPEDAPAYHERLLPNHDTPHLSYQDQRRTYQGLPPNPQITQSSYQQPRSNTQGTQPSAQEAQQRSYQEGQSTYQQPPPNYQGIPSASPGAPPNYPRPLQGYNGFPPNYVNALPPDYQALPGDYRNPTPGYRVFPLNSQGLPPESTGGPVIYHDRQPAYRGAPFAYDNLSRGYGGPMSPYNGAVPLYKHTQWEPDETDSEYDSSAPDYEDTQSEDDRQPIEQNPPLKHRMPPNKQQEPLQKRHTPNIPPQDYNATSHRSYNALNGTQSSIPGLQQPAPGLANPASMIQYLQNVSEYRRTEGHFAPLAQFMTTGKRFYQAGQQALALTDEVLSTIPLKDGIKMIHQLDENGVLTKQPGVRGGVRPFSKDKSRGAVEPPRGVGRPELQCYTEGMTCCMPRAAAPRYRKEPPRLNNVDTPACRAVYRAQTDNLCVNIAFDREDCDHIVINTGQLTVYRSVLVAPDPRMNNVICECTQLNDAPESNEAATTSDSRTAPVIPASARWEFSRHAMEWNQEVREKASNTMKKVSDVGATFGVVSDAVGRSIFGVETNPEAAKKSRNGFLKLMELGNTISEMNLKFPMVHKPLRSRRWRTLQ